MPYTISSRRTDALMKGAISATSSQRSMCKELNQLLNSFSESTDSAADVVKALVNMRTHVDILEEHLSNMYAAIPPPARMAYLAAATPQQWSKLFDVPELLEHILHYLGFHDLLRVQQVNRQMHGAIQASIKLQRKLFLQPEANNHIRLLPKHGLWGFTFETELDEYAFTRIDSNPNKIIVCARFDGYPQILCLGSRCRSIQLCYPPLTSIDVYASCCQEYRGYRTNTSQSPLRILTSETGLTIGDLYDEHARMYAEHRLCPDGSPYSHNKEGFVIADITFEGVIEAVEEDDPVRAKKRKNADERRIRRMEAAAQQARIAAYILGKKAARSNGLPIPTLEQFEAAQASASA